MAGGEDFIAVEQPPQGEVSRELDFVTDDAADYATATAGAASAKLAGEGTSSQGLSGSMPSSPSGSHLLSSPRIRDADQQINVGTGDDSAQEISLLTDTPARGDSNSLLVSGGEPAVLSLVQDGRKQLSAIPSGLHNNTEQPSSHEAAAVEPAGDEEQAMADDADPDSGSCGIQNHASGDGNLSPASDNAGGSDGGDGSYGRGSSQLDEGGAVDDEEGHAEAVYAGTEAERSPSPSGGPEQRLQEEDFHDDNPHDHAASEEGGSTERRPSGTAADETDSGHGGGEGQPYQSGSADVDAEVQSCDRDDGDAEERDSPGRNGSDTAQDADLCDEAATAGSERHSADADRTSADAPASGRTGDDVAADQAVAKDSAEAHTAAGTVKADDTTAENAAIEEAGAGGTAAGRRHANAPKGTAVATVPSDGKAQDTVHTAVEGSSSQPAADRRQDGRSTAASAKALDVAGRSGDKGTKVANARGKAVAGGPETAGQKGAVEGADTDDAGVASVGVNQHPARAASKQGTSSKLSGKQAANGGAAGLKAAAAGKSTTRVPSSRDGAEGAGEGEGGSKDSSSKAVPAELDASWRGRAADQASGNKAGSGTAAGREAAPGPGGGHKSEAQAQRAATAAGGSERRSVDKRSRDEGDKSARDGSRHMEPEVRDAWGSQPVAREARRPIPIPDHVRLHSDRQPVATVPLASRPRAAVAGGRDQQPPPPGRQRPAAPLQASRSRAPGGMHEHIQGFRQDYNNGRSIAPYQEYLGGAQHARGMADRRESRLLVNRVRGEPLAGRAGGPSDAPTWDHEPGSRAGRSRERSPIYSGRAVQPPLPDRPLHSSSRPAPHIPRYVARSSPPPPRRSPPPPRGARDSHMPQGLGPVRGSDSGRDAMRGDAGHDMMLQAPMRRSSMMPTQGFRPPPRHYDPQAPPGLGGRGSSGGGGGRPYIDDMRPPPFEERRFGSFSPRDQYDPEMHPGYDHGRGKAVYDRHGPRHMPPSIRDMPPGPRDLPLLHFEPRDMPPLVPSMSPRSMPGPPGMMGRASFSPPRGRAPSPPPRYRAASPPPPRDSLPHGRPGGRAGGGGLVGGGPPPMFREHVPPQQRAGAGGGGGGGVRRPPSPPYRRGASPPRKRGRQEEPVHPPVRGAGNQLPPRGMLEGAARALPSPPPMTVFHPHTGGPDYEREPPRGPPPSRSLVPGRGADHYDSDGYPGARLDEPRGRVANGLYAPARPPRGGAHDWDDRPRGGGSGPRGVAGRAGGGASGPRGWGGTPERGLERGAGGGPGAGTAGGSASHSSGGGGGGSGRDLRDSHQRSGGANSGSWPAAAMPSRGQSQPQPLQPPGRSAGSSSAAAAEPLAARAPPGLVLVPSPRVPPSYQPDDKVWYYIDPQGVVQGPCSMSQFRQWLQYLSAEAKYHKEFTQFQNVEVWCESMPHRIPLTKLLERK